MVDFEVVMSLFGRPLACRCGVVLSRRRIRSRTCLADPLGIDALNLERVCIASLCEPPDVCCQLGRHQRLPCCGGNISNRSIICTEAGTVLCPDTNVVQHASLQSSHHVHRLRATCIINVCAPFAIVLHPVEDLIASDFGTIRHWGFPLQSETTRTVLAIKSVGSRPCDSGGHFCWWGHHLQTGPAQPCPSHFVNGTHTELICHPTPL